MNKSVVYKIVAVVFVLAAAGITVLRFSNESMPEVKEINGETTVFAEKTGELKNYFQKKKYDLLPHLTGKKPLPRMFVQSLPLDFNNEKYDDIRPALFYEIMTPVILKANETLAKEREQVMALKKEFDENADLSPDSMKKLDNLIVGYGVKPSDDLGTLFDELIPRVDGVTPTLLLTMAAEDSGFGTSRYAREYNAVFHQRDWNGNGAVPDEKQKEGPQYRIRMFPSLYDAVLSQIHYLNTNGYFENYRMARAKYRRTDNLMRGYSVAHLLINFPYKPIKYPDIIKHLIIQYNLTPLDSQKLESVKPATE